MPVITKFEETRDMQKVTMRTITYQDTTEFDPNEGLRAYRKEQNDGIWTITEEHLLTQDENVYVLNVDATTSQDPLETCPNFADISTYIKNYWTTWKKNPNDPALGAASAKDAKSGLWTPEAEATRKDDPDEIFQTFWALYKSGVTSYLAPRIQVRMTRVEDGPPNYSNVGLIDSPPDPFSGDAGEWILNSVRGQQEGDVWRNTYEWMHSAAGKKWESSIYTLSA